LAHEPDRRAADPLARPRTAPFSAEQRAWLNGFFAGLVSLDGAGVTALSPEQSAALMPGARTSSATATTARRRGTTRRCRSPSA
jgi:hypothetical protein